MGVKSVFIPHVNTCLRCNVLARLAYVDVVLMQKACPVTVHGSSPDCVNRPVR